MSRIRKSIIYTVVLAVTAAVITLSVIFVLKLNREYASVVSSSIYARTFEPSGWQYCWGDSPVDADGRFLWLDKNYENSGWTDFHFPGRPPNSGSYRSIWVKAELPDIALEDACVRLRAPQNTAEVYLEDQLIYSYNPHDISERVRTPGSTWHFVDLPEGFGGKTIYIRMSSPFPYLTGYLTHGTVGTRGDHYMEIFNMNMSTLLIGSLCIFLGLAIIMIQILSLYRRNNDVYLGLGSV
ncbi:MAG TPA: hypothetical protein PK423_04425, partial [Clostridiales bacterium]|nr:hypothetical protein [Clostridiales bacterium]